MALMFSPRRQPKVRRRVRFRDVAGKYDAAQTTSENRRHWANADSLSADAASTLGVRRALRERSRYEAANNSWFRGILNTLADDTIGTGPRLQMQSDNAAANQRFEALFAGWAKAVRLADKLRGARLAKAVDGEAFLVIVENLNLDHPVKLDVVPVECDRVTDPHGLLPSAEQCDGILYDVYGNPEYYRVMADHPGARNRVAQPYGSFTEVPADRVIHLFRSDRPGQRRGVPESTPSLELFATMRRYAKAVLMAAENAAENAGWLYTDMPAGSEDLPAAGEAFEELEIARNVWSVAPEGYKAQQLKAEQPTATHESFVKVNLNEAARPWAMPLNVAMANSSGYNYASGRLDHQTYDRSIAVERAVFEGAMDRIVSAWGREARMVGDYLPARFRSRDAAEVTHSWMWANRPHVDPAKEAMAQERKLASGTTNHHIEYALAGRDWETEARQADQEERLRITLRAEREAFERDLRERLSLPPAAPEPRPQAVPANTEPEDESDE